MKDDFMDWSVNNIQFTWKLAWMLSTYWTSNSTMGFSKYEFYNKLLSCVILLRITSGKLEPNSIYIYIELIIFQKYLNDADFRAFWLRNWNLLLALHLSFFSHELFLFFSYLKRKRGNSIFKNSLMKIQL